MNKVDNERTNPDKIDEITTLRQQLAAEQAKVAELECQLDMLSIKYSGELLSTERESQAKREMVRGCVDIADSIARESRISIREGARKVADTIRFRYGQWLKD